MPLMHDVFICSLIVKSQSKMVGELIILFYFMYHLCTFTFFIYQDAVCFSFVPLSSLKSSANAHDMRLQTRESRRRWEKEFCSEIFVPVITVSAL